MDWKKREHHTTHISMVCAKHVGGTEVEYKKHICWKLCRHKYSESSQHFSWHSKLWLVKYIEPQQNHQPSECKYILTKKKPLGMADQPLVHWIKCIFIHNQLNFSFLLVFDVYCSALNIRPQSKDLLPGTWNRSFISINLFSFWNRDE